MPQRFQKPISTLLQYIAPQYLLSMLAGKIAECRFSPLKNYLIRTFISYYRVSIHEAIESNPARYENFQNFFIRRLKAQTRPLAIEKDSFISPVDGTISQIGTILNNHLIQAKGFKFELAGFLGGDEETANRFQDGHFVTLYLAPKDYHRVHFPLDAKLIAMRYIPGRLFSVNPSTTRSVNNLFARNERVVCLFETVSGPMAIILVGAMLVGNIHTTWAGVINAKRKQHTQTWHYVNQHFTFKKGEELGYFNLGSTVIVLMGAHQVAWLPHLCPGKKIQMGELMGKIKL